jgi:Flp pilus assembly pilin Flp
MKRGILNIVLRTENRGSKQSGGAAIEYAALLASIAAMIVVSVSLLGSNLSGIFGNLNFGQPQQLPFMATLNMFETRTMNFYNANHAWPRSWGTYRFSDIGLNPADYQGAVNAVIWNPNGDKIGLNSTSIMYVNDLSGVAQPVYVGQNIWCQAATGVCSLSNGTAVNIQTLKLSN